MTLDSTGSQGNFLEVGEAVRLLSLGWGQRGGYLRLLRTE